MENKRTNRNKGKIQIGVWINEDVYKKTKHLAVELEIQPGIIVELALRKYLGLSDTSKAQGE